MEVDLARQMLMGATELSLSGSSFSRGAFVGIHARQLGELCGFCSFSHEQGCCFCELCWPLWAG